MPAPGRRSRRFSTASSSLKKVFIRHAPVRLRADLCSKRSINQGARACGGRAARTCSPLLLRRGALVDLALDLHALAEGHLVPLRLGAAGGLAAEAGAL